MVRALDECGLSEISDEELVQKAQNNDRDALEAIFKRYRKFVHGQAKAYFLAGAEHDDIVQEGMIGLYKAVCDYDSTKNASFTTFAGLCISRRIFTAIKSATRQKHMVLNESVSLNRPASKESVESLEDTLVGTYPDDPETIVINNESLTGVECSINEALSDLELQVLVYYLDGSTYQEISELINKDMKSVDNAIQRIRKKLEAVLKDKLEEF